MLAVAFIDTHEVDARLLSLFAFRLSIVYSVFVDRVDVAARVAVLVQHQSVHCEIAYVVVARCCSLLADVVAGAVDLAEVKALVIAAEAPAVPEHVTCAVHLLLLLARVHVRLGCCRVPRATLVVHRHVPLLRLLQVRRAIASQRLVKLTAILNMHAQVELTRVTIDSLHRQRLEILKGFLLCEPVGRLRFVN